MSQKLSTEDFIKKARKVHGDKNDIFENKIKELISLCK
jgi:hypothetical protein